MATDIEMRFNTEDSPGRLPLPVMTKLIGALRASNIGDLRYRGYRVSGIDRLSVVQEDRNPLDGERLLSVLERWNSPDRTFTTRTAIRIQDVLPDGSAGGESLLAMRVTASGGATRHRTGNWWIDGDCALTVSATTPFVLPTLPSGQLVASEAVATNLRQMGALLAAVVGSTRPVACKVYTDAGEFLPFNAHLGYYRDPLDVARDLNLIRDLFSVGLPVLELLPLRDLVGAEADFAMHLWRDRQRQAALRTEFAAAVKRESQLTEEAAWAAVPSVPFDSDGLAVAGAVPFLNAFLDTYYLDLLQGG
jgi:hypothetical protein